MSANRPLVMTISLNALEHLGINLYSNIPAVLSEIVANAWDADAKIVTINIDSANGSITIEDNGTGMTRDEVIDRFLTVGFKRRDAMGPKTALGRKPMGRKGIGKLSIFSIANVAEIYTKKGSARTAFKMDREKIKVAIQGKSTNASYKPEEMSKFPTGLTGGTRIVLSGLSKSLSGITESALKRRVARRFSIIGPKNNFVVKVNQNEIGPEDRAFHNMVEYLWTYGNQKDFIASCKNLKRDSEARSTNISAELKKGGISLTGWIGTVNRPSQLKDEDGDNLNRIAVFMRGKLAQEDLLDAFGQKEIFADYLIGELHCDELDVDAKSDIATSSRQTLKEDDPRFEALRKIVLTEIRHIASKWTDWRNSDGTKDAMSVPAVKDWLENLHGNTRQKAERWVGRLNTIRTQNDSDKKELLKASILAFESYLRKDELDSLDNMGDDSIDHVLKIFQSVDDLEVSYYGQIVKMRVKVITALQDKLDANDKELILRNYIFDHLWLLDPSWERAKGTENAEKKMEVFLKENSESLSRSEKQGRIDIGYRTTAGKHVIIELKRASVAVPLDDLVKQVRKYRDGARKVLDKTDFKNMPIEIICLLGKPPPEHNDAIGTGPKGVADALKNVDARIVYYDQLLDNALKAYADYLEVHKKKDKLWGVFAAIDNFAPPISNDIKIKGAK
jgi:hypothetical protein